MVRSPTLSCKYCKEKDIDFTVDNNQAGVRNLTQHWISDHPNQIIIGNKPISELSTLPEKPLDAPEVNPLTFVNPK